MCIYMLNWNTLLYNRNEHNSINQLHLSNIKQKLLTNLKNWCFWTLLLEKTLESPLDCKDIQPVHPKRDQSWIFIHQKDRCWSWYSNILATWCKELTHWKRPWCWERLKAGGEGDDRGWDGWKASPTQRTWVWVNSRSWWYTGRPGMLQSMESQGVRHNWATELTDWLKSFFRIPQETYMNVKPSVVYSNLNVEICSRPFWFKPTPSFD